MNRNIHLLVCKIVILLGNNRLYSGLGYRDDEMEVKYSLKGSYYHWFTIIIVSILVNKLHALRNRESEKCHQFQIT